MQHVFQLNSSPTIRTRLVFTGESGIKSIDRTKMTLKSVRPNKPSKGRRQPQTQPEPESTQTLTGPNQSLLKAISLLVLAGAYSPISQLTLSPVYGSIPSSLYHHYLTGFSFLLAWLLKSRLRGAIRSHWINFLPVLASAVPMLQFYLFRFSRQFGPVYGPLLTEIPTYCLLVWMTVMRSTESFETFSLTPYGQYVNYGGPMLASYVVFSLSERISHSLIEQNVGSSVIFTRTGLQLLIAAAYAVLLPSKFLFLTAIFLLQTLGLNVHISLPWPAELLEKTLKNHQFSLVDRQESLTGYLSVLDNLKDGFRVMRCDHSLLGGEWDPSSELSSSALKEPVYAIFVILEAVRLVISRSAGLRLQLRDNEKRAFVM